MGPDALQQGLKLGVIAKRVSFAKKGVPLIPAFGTDLHLGVGLWPEKVARELSAKLVAVSRHRVQEESVESVLLNQVNRPVKVPSVLEVTNLARNALGVGGIGQGAGGG